MYIYLFIYVYINIRGIYTLRQESGGGLRTHDVTLLLSCASIRIQCQSLLAYCTPKGTMTIIVNIRMGALAAINVILLQHGVT